MARPRDARLSIGVLACWSILGSSAVAPASWRGAPGALREASTGRGAAAHRLALRGGRSLRQEEGSLAGDALPCETPSPAWRFQRCQDKDQDDLTLFVFSSPSAAYKLLGKVAWAPRASVCVRV